MNILLDLTGAEQVTQHLADMELRLLDPTPAMEAIQQIMIRSAQLNFEEQGRPDRWAPLAESTIKRRRNESASSIQILRDTGALMQSLSPAGDEYSIREITPTSVSIGTNRPGAAAHQEGNSRTPQRRFLMHQEQDISDYKMVIADFVVRGSLPAAVSE